MKLKRFNTFIKENNIMKDTELYKNEFFDKVQNHMKDILQQKGADDKFVTDLIVQNQNNIRKMIDTFVNDGTITPDIVAKQLVDKYWKSTVFNNQGNLPEPNKIMGDRAMNKME